MSSERFSGLVNQSTTLQYQFNKRDHQGNYLPFDVFEILKVEIYPTNKMQLQTQIKSKLLLVRI